MTKQIQVINICPEDWDHRPRLTLEALNPVSLKERGGGKIVPEMDNDSKNRKEKVNKKRAGQIVY